MIDFDLNNRVAIVTGGAQGFGLAITKRFIDSGAKVIIWDIDEEETKKALNKINSKNLYYQLVDVSNIDAINKNLFQVEESHGKIDVFINNAGITGMNATVADYPVDEWNKVINLNLNSVFYCCKAVVPFMTRNNYGRIVNIASISKKINIRRLNDYKKNKTIEINVKLNSGKFYHTVYGNDLTHEYLKINADYRS